MGVRIGSGDPSYIAAMKIIVFLAVLALFSSAAFAKVVLVSDIDDTIKNTQVQNLFAAAGNVKFDKNEFAGMRDLYLELQNSRPTSFYYVSNATKHFFLDVPKYHRQFLISSNFPKGEAIFRDRDPDTIHKINAIKRILSSENAHGDVTDVILFGDNGEKDPYLYNEVVKFHESAAPQIRFHVFIHMAYWNSANLEAGQIGYATPLEVSLSLEKAGLLTRSTVDRLAKILLPKVELTDEGNAPTMFPSWLNCAEMRWLWTEEAAERDYVRNLRDSLADKCRI